MSEYCWKFSGQTCAGTPRASDPICNVPYETNFCVTVIAENPQIPIGGTGHVPSTNTWAQTVSGSGLGESGAGGSGSYTPNQCNPNLPGGTVVPPNQLPPCTALTSAAINPIAGGITRVFSSLEEIKTDDEFEPLWNQLNDFEKNWFQTGLNWLYAPDFLVSFAMVKTIGILYFNSPDADNTNSNAFRHMLFCGLNSLTMGEEKARVLGILHEKNNQIHPNQPKMDSINNEEGLKLARVHKNSITLTSAISNYMKDPNTLARKLYLNAPGGALIKTDGTGRTAWGNTH